MNSALSKALYEWVLIVVPVPFYLTFELFAGAAGLPLYESAEWGITTIFLLLTAGGLLNDLGRSAHFRLRTNRARWLMVLMFFMAALAASVSSYILASEHAHPQHAAIPTRLLVAQWGLLLMASIMFLCLKYAMEAQHGPRPNHRG